MGDLLLSSERGVEHHQTKSEQSPSPVLKEHSLNLTKFGRCCSLTGFLVSFYSSGAWSQGVSFQLNVGLGINGSEWSGASGGFIPLALPFVGELGASFDIAPRQKIRFLLSSFTDFNFSNEQIAIDYQWALVSRNDKALYVLVGLSENVISGKYTFHLGDVPPKGLGDYRHVDQRWRPGLKLGVGFQWTKQWAVELDGHLISMATTGYQSVPKSSTPYASVVVSFRFPESW